MKLFLVLGVINGFLAVALGAFGAHGLEGKVSEKALDVWEKAVRYQMFHTAMIFIIGILLLKIKSSAFLWSGWLFVVGIILFSGSLYVYSATGVRSLAMITPFGGVTFLIGWIVLGYALTKQL